MGLMVCLGEALQGALYGEEWFNGTIPAGVKEGLKDLKLKELPQCACFGRPETPADIVDEVGRHADQAEQAITKARAHVTRRHDEFERLAADIATISLLTSAYTFKVKAAIRVLAYKRQAARDYLRFVELLAEALRQPSVNWEGA